EDQVMSQDAKLEPGAVGAVVVGGNRVECKLAFEFGDSLFLSTAAGGEVPQGAWGESKIGRYRRVFEVTIVGREEIELVILGAAMMHPLAVDDHAQLKFPGRQRQAGFAAADIRGNRAPARLCGNQRFDPGPLTEGHLDRIKAARAGEQLEEILLENGRVHAEFQCQRAPQALAHFAINWRTKASAPLESWTLPGRFFS